MRSRNYRACYATTLGAALCVFGSCGLLISRALGQTESPGPGAAGLSAAGTSVVPRLVNFGGTVKDASGKPATGDATLTFSLYQLQEGGNPLWSETQSIQLDAQGHYTVLLGATQPDGLPLDLFTSGQARWLGVQPQLPGVGELPRVLLVGVPYALKAADADTLGGKPASAFVLSGPQPTISGTTSAAASGALVAPAIAGAAGETSGGNPANDSLATSCTSITADGTAKPNQVAKFTAPCVIHQSLIWDNGTNVGIGNKSPSGKLDVSGTSFFRGTLTLPAIGTATASQGYKSQPSDWLASAFNSSTHAAVSEHFRWQAEPVGNNMSSPSGKFNLLFASGSGTPAETGLSISSNGIITFASGQTLPTVSGNEMVTGEITAKNSAGQAGAFTSTKEGSSGLTASGGDGTSNNTGGTGIVANGGTELGFETSGNGGVGVQANGGQSVGGVGGAGVQATGGVNPSLQAGAGVVATGGYSSTAGVAGAGVEGTGGTNGAPGVVGTGGLSYGVGGTGVVATGGDTEVGGIPSGDGIDAMPGSTGSGGAFAGFFSGNVNVTDTLTASMKKFLIDHPLDPANKYLYHSSVESSEMMNIYTGNTTLDANGQATVQLPNWFQGENADFRYQLTAIGAPAPGLYIAQEVQNNSFRIAGGQARMKVSWQLTAIRQDAYVKAHPLVVEVDKPQKERGYFIHPELYGAPAEKGIEWARHPELMKLIKEKREKQDKEAQAMRAQSASHRTP